MSIATLVNPRESWQADTQPVRGPLPVAPGTWVIHYPGGGGWFPRTDEEIKAYLRAIQNDYLTNRGYSIGYNWGAGQNGSGWEIRGDDFRAASNPGRKLDQGNFNALSQSIFVMVGGADPASPEAVAKINEIIATQPTWAVKVHMDVDFTACCGVGLIGQVRSGVIGHGGLVLPPQPPVDLPTGYNPPADWWLFPLDGNKPSVRLGDRSIHVAYLNDVFYFAAEGAAQRGDLFTEATARAVENIQRMFGLTVDRVVGPAETWPVIDYLVSLYQPPPPPQPPAPGDDAVVGSAPLSYVVQRGDSPWSVGQVVYGSGVEGANKLDASLFNTYSTPGNPHIISIPDSSGVTTLIQSGEGPYTAARRMNVSLTDFYAWNGGDDRTFHPGDRVWAPQ